MWLMVYDNCLFKLGAGAVNVLSCEDVEDGHAIVWMRIGDDGSESAQPCCTCWERCFGGIYDM